MTAGRELGTGLLYGLLSLVLVIGSLSLALSESNSTSPPTAAASPTGTVTVLPRATASTSPRFTLIPSLTQPPPTATPTSTVALAPPPPMYPLLQSTAFSPPRPGTFMRSCSPFRGWVRGYLVQPGDDLFLIAGRYHTTVEALERANCRPNSILYAGERLWVPYVQTLTEGQTIILVFDTPTESPTESSTPTP